MFIALIPALFFGWSLGANDASNVFGTAVTNGIVKFRIATIISAVFIIIGALIDGPRGLETISSLSSQTLLSAAIASLSAAATVTLMTWLGLPVSSSQAMVGSILGIGILKANVQWHILVKVVLAWLGTPIGGIIFGFLGYKVFARYFNRIRSLRVQDLTIKVAAIIIGAYGSYALGGNNVANVTGIFAGIIPVELAALIGGISIAFGVLTFSKRVMLTVGKEIVALDSFSAVIAVFGESVTVWIYALIGVPVSTSQAIVGAVIGAGLARGSVNVNAKTIKRIVLGWLETPLVSGILAILLFSIARLFIR
ncbi:phosphate permease [Kosmotoga arenicorallina S304]|uniref:Phosphate permease n=1 Tax=Kosmotoga arenicorallina S304 TaxID=1453497 RepID=A0A176JXF9_9BACT|nr:inorganic phosphate transporter [Kosmotoga arenicorallina]OAA28416.1 phosphate permease [Kosmotoga arenicorallina S304]